VVGRSGRGQKPGRAVIQTYTPDNETILQAADYLKRGVCSIGIFPEGTRHDEIGQGKTGAAMMAIRTNSPILPVYINPDRVKGQPTKVYIGEPYMPFTEDRRATAADYERVTEDIMDHIRAIRDSREEREAAEA